MQKSQIEFRKATAEDYEDVFALFSEVQSLHHDAHPDFFRKPEKDDLFREFFDKTLESEEQYLIIGCLDDEAVGYILFFEWVRPPTISRLEQRNLYIHQIIIKERYRYQRYGEVSIDYAKRTARKLGISRMGIDFCLFNEPARKCFERQGFTGFIEAMLLDL